MGNFSLYTDPEACFLFAATNSVDIDPAFTYGVTGRICADETAVAPDQPFPSPIQDKSCPDLPVSAIA